MSEAEELLVKMSGPTKAYIIVNEFVLGNLELPQLKELMQILARTDLERIGIMELIREELITREVAQEEQDLLLGGLKGAPSAPLTKQRRATDVKRKENINVVPFQSGKKTEPIAKPQPQARSTGGVQPPKPPPLYPGQGKRAPRRTGFIKMEDGPLEATQKTPPPASKKAYFGEGAGTFSSMGTENKPHILIADDDPRIRMIFRMKLQDAGYKVIEAQNGDEAWKMIQEESPRAVVMDMKMPGLHGLEVLARLTQQGGNIPAIVCSAYDQLKDEFVVANYPQLEYFVKPVNPDELLKALKKFVPIQG